MISPDVLAIWENPREPDHPDEPIREVWLTLRVQTLLDGPALLDKIHRILAGGDVMRQGRDGMEVVRLSRFPRGFRSLSVDAIYAEGDDE